MTFQKTTMAVSAGSWVQMLMQGSRLAENRKKVVLLDSCAQDFQVYSVCLSTDDGLRPMNVLVLMTLAYVRKHAER